MKHPEFPEKWTLGWREWKETVSRWKQLFLHSVTLYDPRSVCFAWLLLHACWWNLQIINAERRTGFRPLSVVFSDFFCVKARITAFIFVCERVFSYIFILLKSDVTKLHKLKIVLLRIVSVERFWYWLCSLHSSKQQRSVKYPSGYLYVVIFCLYLSVCNSV